VLTPTDAEEAAVGPDGPVPDGAGPRRRLLAVLAAAALVVVTVVAADAVRPGGPPAPPPGSWTLAPHRGLGAWVDVYDWTVELGGTTPSVDVEDIDAMAEAGVQTLYLQTSHRRSSSDVMERERLEELIDRAHERGLHVVAWYLPTFVDVGEDLDRLLAAAALRVDGLGVDIEATDVADPVERNARLLDLSARLRQELGSGKTLAAITLSSVHVGVVNPAFWPGYPYAELGAAYDVVLPMAYWTLRRGDLAESRRYVGENLDRIRALVGPDVPLHPIGGIADAATTADLEGLVDAVEAGGAIGASLYDWSTSTAEQWALLRPLRDLRPGG
jgi:hypothetical protein